VKKDLIEAESRIVIKEAGKNVMINEEGIVNGQGAVG
jgi:hypothetical protein